VAFALVEIRDIAGTHTGPLPKGRWSGLPSSPGPNFAEVRKAMLLGAVLCTHLAIFWFARLSQLNPPVPASTGSMLIIDIPAAADPPEPALAPEPRSTTEPSSAVHDAPRAAEWSRTSVRVLPPPAAARVSAPPPLSNPAATGSSTGSTIYDPYAGVAPLRQPGPPPAIPMTLHSEAPTAELVLGQTTSDRLAASIRRRAKHSQGRVQIRAHIAANGAVTRVDILSSTVNDQTRILLIDEARKLRFSSGPERWIVGTINLG
jgi:hypothetical protein